MKKDKITIKECKKDIAKNYQLYIFYVLSSIGLVITLRSRGNLLDLIYHGFFTLIAFLMIMVLKFDDAVEEINEKILEVKKNGKKRT